jgi:hypothetical protein
MAIRALQKSVPRDLPEAKLHLDDVEEICEILKSPPSAWEANFVVDDKQCDGFEDLKELRKRTDSFRISLSAEHRSRTLSISKYRTELEIYDYPPDEQLRWSLYARVEAVFKRKRLGIKGRAGYLLAIFLLCAADAFFLKHLPWSWGKLITIPLAGLVGVIVGKMATQPSAVVLAYSHTTWSLRGFWENEENRSKLAIAVVTALITLAAKAAFDRLTK